MGVISTYCCIWMCDFSFCTSLTLFKVREVCYLSSQDLPRLRKPVFHSLGLLAGLRGGCRRHNTANREDSSWMSKMNYVLM